MPENWMAIRVQLIDGGTSEMRYPPGRVMLVGPTHTFRQLADAINVAFARWDLSHLHEFELADSRRIGLPDDEWDDEEHPCLDDTTLAVTSVLNAGDQFSFVFDLGDYWLHRCTVERDNADPNDAYGSPPATPVPVWGWGEIPDQYGRRWTDDTGEDDDRKRLNGWPQGNDLPPPTRATLGFIRHRGYGLSPVRLLQAPVSQQGAERLAQNRGLARDASESSLLSSQRPMGGSTEM